MNAARERCGVGRASTGVKPWLFVLSLGCLVAAGCHTAEFSHYEPTVVPLASSKVYERAMKTSPVLADATVVYAEPLGLREARGGLIVDVLLTGEPLRDRILQGDVRAPEPVPLLAVSISQIQGEVVPAGPPAKVVDSTTPVSWNAMIDPAESLFVSILDVPAKVPTRIVSIPVVPARPVAAGAKRYVRVLTQEPHESRMAAWLPPGTRIMTPERELPVR